MPIQGPIWSGRARDVYEEDEALRYRKAADEKLRRLQAMPSAKLGPDTPMRGPRANGPRGWQINPKGIETQNGMAGGSAMPASAPTLDSAERDMTMLGPSPRLSARDIAGDPVPANAQEGIGGPDQDIAEMARAELERRKSQGSPADPQAQAMQELARRQGAASQPPGDNTQDGFALDVLRRQGMLPPEQTGGVGNLPEIQQAAPKLPTRPQVYIPPPGPPAAPSGAQAFMANTFQSATFGQGDKIRGGVAAALGGNYDNEVARSREWLKQAREKEPGYSFLGEAAGFLAPGAAIGKGVGLATRGAVNGVTRMAPALNFAARTGAAAAEGAVGGAAYGYTTGAENRAIDQGAASPGLLAQERIDSTGSNAAMGAVFGGAMPAVDVMTRPVRNFIGGAVSRIAEPFAPGAVAAHNKRIAAGAARRAFERAGIVTVDDLVKRAAKYGDKPVVAGELSQGTLNNLTNIVRRPGTSADKAMAVLEDRVAGMPGRMLKDIAEETGLQPDEVMGSIEDMVKAGRERAAPLYTTAEEAPFAETANLERIVKDAPILQGLMSKAKNRVQNQAVAQIGQVDQMPPLKIYDELKQLVDEEIQARIVNGQGIDDIQGVRDVLVRELDNISGQAATGLEVPPDGSSLYAAAREAGGDAPRIKQGLKDGGGALSGAKMADEVAREVADIRGQQLTAYQIGVIRSMVKGVENGTLTPKRVKTLGFQKKLNEVFGEPAAKGLIQKFGVEAELSQKGARWNANVGAVTSQATLGGPSKAGDEMLRAATNAATGNKIGLITQAIDGLRRMGYSEKQLDEIGNIFLSTPDDAAKAMFPGQSPKPGSIPPPTPPAGRVRTNPPAPPQGPPPAGQNTYKQLSAQADEAWKNGQWELANDLQRQANALKAGPPPKTEAPSKGGADRGPIVKNGLFPSKQPLPMDEASRMGRAREQGFDVDTPLYHGTAGDVEAFDFEDIANMDFDTGSGVFLTRSPSEAGYFTKTQTDSMGSRSNEYVENANIMPVYARLRNPVVFETQADFRAAVADTSYDRRGHGYGFKRDMEALGHDGVIVRNSQMDGQDGAEWRIIFDPKNIRGKFAQFDPSQSGSSKLLAGMGASPEAVGGATGAGIGYFANPYDANDDGVIDDKDRGLNAMGGLMSGVVGGNIAKRGMNAMRNITPPKGPPTGPAQATFGGVKAKTADLKLKGIAEQMEKAGASRDQIWKETGWFKGNDGKWRFEIDDSGAKLTGKTHGFLGNTNAASERLLGDGRPVLEHSELYDAYPDLKGAHASISGKGGEYTPVSENNFETVRAGQEDPLSILLHEAGGHGVQAREDFARGGSMSGVLEDPELREMVFADARSTLTPSRFEAYAQKWDISDTPRARADHAKLVEQQNQALSQLSRLEEKTSWDGVTEVPVALRQAAHRVYSRLAGETEARNVQTRRDFTPEERRARPPWTTQDVPDDQQIVRYGSSEQRSEGPWGPRGSRPNALADMFEHQAAQKQLKELETYRKTAPASEHAAVDQEIADLRGFLEGKK